MTQIVALAYKCFSVASFQFIKSYWRSKPPVQISQICGSKNEGNKYIVIRLSRLNVQEHARETASPLLAATSSPLRVVRWAISSPTGFR